MHSMMSIPYIHFEISLFLQVRGSLLFPHFFTVYCLLSLLLLLELYTLSQNIYLVIISGI
jgi:hypothetical protein